MISGFSDVSVGKVREYWNARPCNVRHSSAVLGSREYFDQVESRKYFVEPHIPVFADFDNWKGKSVLEIGCGIGTDTINFARVGAEVTAVDLSVESLEIARKRAEVMGVSSAISFFEADAEHLSEFIPPREYDLVYSFGVIHHSPHPVKIIKQVREHFSRKGTTFKLMVYNRRSWKVWRMLLEERLRFWKLDEIVAKHSEAQTGCPVTYSFSLGSAKQLLGSGFEVTDMFIDHIFPYQIDKYVKYEYEMEWYFRHLPRAVFRGLERRFGWHLCLTANAK